MGFTHDRLPSGLPTKIVYVVLITPHTCHTPHPPFSSRLDYRTILCEEYRSLSSSLCSFLHSPFTSSLLGPNIFLNTLFSNTISLRSSLNVSDQVPHTYKKKNKQNYSSVYLNLYIFGLQNGRQNILHRMAASIAWLQSALSLFLNRILVCYRLFPNIWTLPPFPWNCNQSLCCDFFLPSEFTQQ